ncbi:MAG: autotransporter domain-containing protein [Deltaproteobacteria bacterium]|jgi:hypothetical protein|nr:autotransporter domain-containing protein [Deltaproteobacteria bacterium]
MSQKNIVAKISSFFIMTIYILAIVLTFYLIVVVTSGVAKAEDLVWDDPATVPSQTIFNRVNDYAIYPANSFSDNNVKILVDINAHVLGGYHYLTAPSAETFEVNRNFISVIDKERILAIYGGYVANDYPGFIAGNINVNDNIVEVKNSQAWSIVGGNIQAYADVYNPPIGLYSAISNKNIVNVYNSDVLKEIIGGKVFLCEVPGEAEASYNKIYVEKGQAEAVHGGYALNSNNQGPVIGKANYNEAYLKDLKVTLDVIMGKTEADKYSQANNNILTLSGETAVGRDVIGGKDDDLSNPLKTFSDHFSGNVLRVYRPQATGITVGRDLNNFEFYEFAVSSQAPSGSFGLKVANQLTLNDGATKASYVRSLELLDDGIPQASSIDFVLFDSPNDIDYTNFIKPDDSKATPFNALLVYDLKYAQTPKQLSATFSNFRVSEETIILPDAPSAGLDLINEGGDLLVDGGPDPIDLFGPEDGVDPLDGYGPNDGVDPLDGYGPDDGFDPLDKYGSGEGLDPLEKEEPEKGFGQDAPYMDRQKEAQNRLREEREKADKRREERLARAKAAQVNPCPRAFVKAKGGQNKRDEGRELTVTSYSLLAGVDCGQKLESGLLTFGLAFEGGLGSYDSKRALPTGLIRGSGDLDYAGGVLLGRFDFRPSKLGRFYVESGFRLGQINSDFQTRDFSGAKGRQVSYDSNNSYMGLQLGVGDYIVLNKTSYLNAYLQYFWVKLKGGDVKLNTGQVVKIDAINSRRLRAGAQYHKAISRRWRVFGGAAYERETDGETNAYYGQYKLPNTNKKGGSGLFELGLAFNSKSVKPATFSLAFQGNVGQRRGGAVVAQLAIVF